MKRPRRRRGITWRPATGLDASPYTGAPIQQWQPQPPRRYELIVSNPPFFAEGVPCATSQREQARYTTSLDHTTLLTCAADLITEEGFFCVVLPVDIGNAFVERAKAMGWRLRSRTDVAETEMRPPHRALLAFSPSAGECFSDRLVVRGPGSSSTLKALPH